MCFDCIHDSMPHELDEFETPTQGKNIKLEDPIYATPAASAKGLYAIHLLAAIHLGVDLNLFGRAIFSPVAHILFFVTK